MQAVESVDCYDVGLYTGYYWFTGNSNPTTHAAQYNYLKDKPLWLAWYTSNPANVKIPAPWTNWEHWQWGTPSVGKEYGAATIELDMNKHNGDLSKYGAVTPPPGETMTGLAKEILGKSPSVRDAPSVSGNKLYSLPPYSVDIEFIDFARDLNGVDWWLDLGGGKYVNLEVAGVRYLIVTRMPTTEPEPPPVSEPAVMEIMLADGSSVIVRDVAGSELFRWP